MSQAIAAAPSPTLWQRAWAELRVGLPICFGVAGFFTLVFPEPFGHNLVFSLCIGLLIQGLITAGRHGFSTWQRRRGLTCQALMEGWPGWAWMGPWIPVSVALGYLGGHSLASWLLGLQVHALPSNRRALLLVLAIVLMVAAGTTYFFATRARLASVQAAAEAAQRAAAEHQLMLLQSQLEPHMLFNTLANLRVLIGSDPARAQAMLDRLIAFLRSTLQASRSAMHPLSTEFDRLADYLSLMQVRMGPRLTFDLQLPEPMRGLPVPPLLLQPLVENSIKHGLEPQVAGGRIVVQAQHQGDTLQLSVRDNGVGMPSQASDGFGTSQVRQRLATLYGDRAMFTQQALPDGGSLAIIALPLATSA